MTTTTPRMTNLPPKAETARIESSDEFGKKCNLAVLASS